MREVNSSKYAAHPTDPKRISWIFWKFTFFSIQISFAKQNNPVLRVTLCQKPLEHGTIHLKSIYPTHWGTGVTRTQMYNRKILFQYSRLHGVILLQWKWMKLNGHNQTRVRKADRGSSVKVKNSFRNIVQFECMWPYYAGNRFCPQQIFLQSFPERSQPFLAGTVNRIGYPYMDGGTLDSNKQHFFFLGGLVQEGWVFIVSRLSLRSAWSILTLHQNAAELLQGREELHSGLAPGSAVADAAGATVDEDDKDDEVVLFAESSRRSGPSRFSLQRRGWGTWAWEMHHMCSRAPWG